MSLTSLANADDPRPNDLSDIWVFAKENIYPPELSTRFLPEVYDELNVQLRENPQASVADVINPFLTSLGISHTYLYDENDLGYYLFRSMFTTRDIASPKVVHIGIQSSSREDGLLVDAVLEGGPAYRAGIKRGDIITAVKGVKPTKDSAFFSYEGRAVEIDVITRNGTRRSVTVQPIEQSIHAALAQATRESVKIIKRDDLRFGYLHLWAGTDQQFLDTLRTTVLETFSDVDGIILDLRDGYGGAWWPYLDPFFPDTNDYFVAKKLDREGHSEYMKPERTTNSVYYSGPLVVLINGGVRSGKEALAYQFKKSDRATLIGTTTAGAFVGGLGGFANKDRGFILYLSVFGMYLDDHQIEGKGISPHIEVSPYDSEHDDPQLERAILEAIHQQANRRDSAGSTRRQGPPV
ncbi:S41 family peptidase [Gilvimarinus sp. F26214L]|uniref:S41 family peptidase n=1 Tax=Gilvimarinus sp. DZF01 TaxID=3461371 RepID=UPI00404560C5